MKAYVQFLAFETLGKTGNSELRLKYGKNPYHKSFTNMNFHLAFMVDEGHNGQYLNFAV